MRDNAAPGLVVTDEILFAAVRVGAVADGHHGARDLDEQFRGGFRAGKIFAISDVAGADENCGLIVRNCLNHSRTGETRSKILSGLGYS